MPTYRLLLEYDGSAFHGWQVQPDLRTVQGEIERALSILTREPVGTAGAGRTDRGVHARGQVVSFRTARPIDCRRVILGIHGICGRDLIVRRLEAAPDRFHARHDARWRDYSYRILDRRSALWRGRAWHPPRLPSLPILRRASEPLLGRHDFTSFANRSPDEAPPECEVRSLGWHCWEEGFLFTIRADRFLYKMVRNLVGTLIRVGHDRGPGAEAEIETILRARSRKAASDPAPPDGLCFEGAGYDPPWP